MLDVPVDTNTYIINSDMLMNSYTRICQQHKIYIVISIAAIIFLTLYV
jgi:hypothetical protein